MFPILGDVIIIDFNAILQGTASAAGMACGESWVPDGTVFGMICVGVPGAEADVSPAVL